MHPRRLINFPVLAIALVLSQANSVVAQSRDYLTPAEIELVKEAQALDKRVDVFIKAVQRRLILVTGTAATTIPANNSKQAKKEAELWGEMPAGSRAELLGDIAKILDAAIDNIDDVSFHDEKSPLLPKALRKLSAAATQFITQLEPLRSQTKSEAEFGSLNEAMDNAESIVEAAKKLPAVTEPEKGAKEKKPKEKPSGT